jgi:hypothetical protein
MGIPSVNQPNISHNTVAFTFGNNSTQGIMVEHGGHLEQVIAAGDTLDGHTVAAVQMGLQSLSGRYLAFEADFTDGSHGIYRVTLDGGGGSAAHDHSVAADSSDHSTALLAHHHDFLLI